MYNKHANMTPAQLDTWVQMHNVICYIHELDMMYFDNKKVEYDDAELHADMYALCDAITKLRV